jgi:hypothetical protein
MFGQYERTLSLSVAVNNMDPGVCINDVAYLTNFKLESMENLLGA